MVFIQVLCSYENLLEQIKETVYIKKRVRLLKGWFRTPIWLPLFNEVKIALQYKRFETQQCVEKLLLCIFFPVYHWHFYYLGARLFKWNNSYKLAKIESCLCHFYLTYQVMFYCCMLVKEPCTWKEVKCTLCYILECWVEFPQCPCLSKESHWYSPKSSRFHETIWEMRFQPP